MPAEAVIGHTEVVGDAPVSVDVVAVDDQTFDNMEDEGSVLTVGVWLTLVIAVDDVVFVPCVLFEQAVNDNNISNKLIIIPKAYFFNLQSPFKSVSGRL